VKAAEAVQQSHLGAKKTGKGIYDGPPERIEEVKAARDRQLLRWLHDDPHFSHEPHFTTMLVHPRNLDNADNLGGLGALAVRLIAVSAESQLHWTRVSISCIRE
jgi:hypothetical protein